MFSQSVSRIFCIYNLTFFFFFFFLNQLLKSTSVYECVCGVWMEEGGGAYRKEEWIFYFKSEVIYTLSNLFFQAIFLLATQCHFLETYKIIQRCEWKKGKKKIFFSYIRSRQCTFQLTRYS